MLGNNYAPEFFNGVPDKVGDPLKRICEETLEDLEGYKEILQQFGVEVLQPRVNPNERFLDNPGNYSRGPLQPRDAQLVIGNELVFTWLDTPEIEQRLLEYSDQNVVKSLKTDENTYNLMRGDDWPEYTDYLANNYSNCPDEIENLFAPAPNITVVGKDVYVDIVHGFNKKTWDEKFGDQFRTTALEIGGHNDACFHTIKPGAILSLQDIQNYKNKGKWWVPGEEKNDEFTNFIETWLQDWVGYVEETVFDVNVLVLDEHHVCVANPNNEQVNTFLKKHNMEPVYVPWRHRYFWDGGLHCITLDLVRRGTQKDYFNR
jgi:glycine amidinotransferase